MELIAEIVSKELKEQFGNNVLPRDLMIAKNVRGILLNDENKIALAFYENKDHHSLPGGGVEGDEKSEEAMLREILEETGFESEIHKEIGFILEIKKGRNEKDSLIITYCYSLKSLGNFKEPKFTEREKETGLVIKWVSLSEAEEILEKESIELDRVRDYLLFKKFSKIIN